MPKILEQWLERVGANRLYAVKMGKTIVGCHNVAGIDDSGEELFRYEINGRPVVVWMSAGNWSILVESYESESVHDSLKIDAAAVALRVNGCRGLPE